MSRRYAMLETARGRVRVGYQHASPADARGTVVILPGRGEFIEKYDEPIARWTGRGFAVAAIDWGGQGASYRLLRRRERGHAITFEVYLDELESLLAHLGALQAPQPWCMLANSMGGHIGLRYLVERDAPRRHRRFASAVMVAPMFDIDLKFWPRPVARAIALSGLRLGIGGAYAPGQGDLNLSRCRFETNVLTSCRSAFEEWRTLLLGHPDKIVGGATFGWIAATMRSIDRTRAPGYLDGFACRMLVVQAEDERLVVNAVQNRVVERIAGAELTVVRGGRHDLFFEARARRERMYQAIEAFMVSQVEAPAPLAANA